MPAETAFPIAPVAEPTVGRRQLDAPPAPPRCANCGAAMEGEDRFCRRCGQDRHDYHRSLGSIFGEALDALAGWDAKIPSSIWLLLARPGRLTTEFLRGRRVRYLRPLRLYLLLSVVFFFAARHEASRSKGRFIKLDDSTAETTPAPPSAAQQTTEAGSALSQAAEEFREGMRARERGESVLDSARMGEFLARRLDAPPPDGLGAIKSRFKDRVREITRLPEEQRDRMLRDAFLAKLGNTAICLVPVFALLLRVLYSRARLYYAEHFVVALHTHAFAFGTLTLLILLAEANRAATGHTEGALRSVLGVAISSAMTVLAVWLPVYPFMALRRVYGGSRVATLARYVVLGSVYGVVLATALVLTVFAAILFG